MAIIPKGNNTTGQNMRIFLLITCMLLILPDSLSAQAKKDSLVTWTKYIGRSAFSVLIPSTVELRKPEDAYTIGLKLFDLWHNERVIVFQQKGLSHIEGSAFKTYCRIMIHYENGEYGDYLKSSESESLDTGYRDLIAQLVISNIGPLASLMGCLSYKWITLNGVKCLQIDYRRTGANFNASIPVVCRIAIFQNDSEMVMMTLAYREKEADLWKTAFEKVFKSFRWI